jgi:hypothetical protein
MAVWGLSLRVGFAWSVVVALGSSGDLSAQASGHRVSANQVIIETQRHWENWEFPLGTLEIEDGSVQPQRLQRNTNAVVDIVDFLRLNTPDHIKKDPEEIILADAVQVGSNSADAFKAIDGDPMTYWQPEPVPEGIDLPAQWWLNLDLGRFVFAKKIVLKFVDEEMGDPFLLFDVLVSDGFKPKLSPLSATPNYTTVMRLLQENKTQRVFEIDLEETDEEPQGMGLRFVQLVINGTDGTRGRQVTETEYGELPAGERGAIEYYKHLRSGGELQVDQDVYEMLSAEKQAEIRHFRRERPRLAEIEVWGEGDEILSGTITRGGFISTTEPGVSLGPFIDGRRETSSIVVWGVGGWTGATTEINNRELVFDLGTFYWVDTHLLAYGGRNLNSFGDYRLEVSDGSVAADGSLEWTRVLNKGQSDGTASPIYLELTPSLRRRGFEGNTFAPVQARFFRMQWTVATFGANAELAEVQLYGEGFLPRLALESDLIRLGGSRNLLSIEWESDTPPGTEVRIQTRTGNELGEVLHYFKKDGTEVTENQYGKMLSLFRGEIVPEEVAGNDWSDWSEPYTLPAGSAITSPSPREFLKVRATLVSEDPQVAASIRSVRLNFVDPVAQGLIGEVVPFQVDSLGSQQPFSLYIRPDFDRGDSGFDELLLVVPEGMSLDFTGFYAGAETDFMSGGDVAAMRVEDAELMATETDSLLLSFPLVQPNNGIELLRLDFNTALFSTGAVLRPSLQNRASGEGAWQRVDAGNAFELATSNTTTLVGSLGNKQLLRDVRVAPPVFSPNGDGINDEAQFEFKVVRVGDDSPVEVQIYDLSGKAIRRLAEQRTQSSGEYQIAWDGKDQFGQVVPPGIYYARLKVSTQTAGAGIGARQILKTLSVAY